MILVDYPDSENSTTLAKRDEIDDVNILKPKTISKLENQMHEIINRADVSDHEKSKLYNNSLGRYLYLIDQHRSINDNLKQDDYTVLRDIEPNESLDEIVDTNSDNDDYQDIADIENPRRNKKLNSDEIIARLKTKYRKRNPYEIQYTNKLKKKAIEKVRNDRKKSIVERERTLQLIHDKDLAKRNLFRRYERERNKKRIHNDDADILPSKKKSSLRVLNENYRPGRISRRRKSKESAVKKLANFYKKTRKIYNKIAEEVEKEKENKRNPTLKEILRRERIQKRLIKKRRYREHKKIDGTNNDKGLLDNKRLRGSRKTKRLHTQIPIHIAQISKIKDWVDLESIDLTEDDDN